MPVFSRKLVMFFVVSCQAFYSLAVEDSIRSYSLPYSEYRVLLTEDSSKGLKKLLENPPKKEDTDVSKAQYYQLLSGAYSYVENAEEIVKNAELSLMLITEASEPWLYHRAQISRSVGLQYLNQGKSSLKSLDNAINWGESVGDIDIQIDALLNKVNIHITLSDVSRALELAQKGYELAPRSFSGASVLKGHFASLIGFVYGNRLEYDLAEPFYEEAVTDFRNNNDIQALADNLVSLGIVQSNLEKYDSARATLLESLAKTDPINNAEQVGYIVVELASIETKEENYSIAKSYLDRAINIFTETQNRILLFISHKNMARLATALKDFQLADTHIALAKEFVDESDLLFQSIPLREENSRLEYGKQNYKEAYEMLESTILQKEHLFSKESAEQLHVIRAQHEVDVSDSQNQQLEFENSWQLAQLEIAKSKQLQLTFLFGALVIICLLLGFIVYRSAKNRAKLLYYANTDSLTGLLNRRQSLHLIEQQIEIAKRHNYELSIALIDIDFFKQINDTYGHAAGDKVLSAFGTLCSSSFRSSDIIGRIGGEEFIIALPNTSIEKSQILFNQLLEKTQELGDSLGVDDLKLTISCGLGSFSSALNAQQMMNECDQALYEAKESGRNQIMLCT